MTISCLLLSRKSKRYRSNCHMISWLLNENKVNLMVKTDFIIFNMLFVFSDIPNVFLQHSNFYFSPRVFETVLPISENCNLGEKQCFWLPWNLLPLLILIISGVLQSFFIFFCVHWTCAASFFSQMAIGKCGFQLQRLRPTLTSVSLFMVTKVIQGWS